MDALPFDTEGSAPIAVVVGLGLLVVFGLIQIPMLHRALTWGTCWAYAALLVYLATLGLAGSREFFFKYAPELAVGKEDQQYASNCDGSLASIVGTLDVFVLAHSLGYWGKMLIMRSFPMVWIISLGFEHIEVLFQHMLPNFLECWWDHIVLDVLLCNFGGMVLGWATLKALKFDTFHWFRGVAGSPKRAVLLLVPVVMCMVCETCLFFLKFYLQHPPSHWLVLVRMLFWFNLSMRCYPLYFHYLEGQTWARPEYVRAPRLPNLVVMSCLLIGLELYLCMAFHAESEIAGGPPMPTFLSATFACAVALCALAAVAQYVLKLRPVATLLLLAAAAVISLAHLAGIPKLEWKQREVAAAVDAALRALNLTV
eukprot:TRINITY_DN16558_c0_g1_i1.p1 TRINITY_DN16558_c0_g1~~TRINITY_DN16558_c0_g1_i1.p1  ORF type:complete len:369 (+),score=111.51 TRINITY_DN16558_c0_g1_i1:82-1188(+)